MIKQIESQIKDLMGQWAELKNAEVATQKKIQYAGNLLGQEEYKAMMDAVFNNWWSGGKYTIQAEEALARMSNRKYAVLTNSGSSANLLVIAAMKELGYFKTGDKILTTSCGFPTTVNPIIQCGLIPVFVDIDLETMNIDVEAAAKAAEMDAKITGVFVAHTLGFPCDIPAIEKIGLPVIYDNCDSYGSWYRSIPLPAFGDAATMSFYAAHHITMFEGGAVVTDCKWLFEAVRGLRNWGKHCSSEKCCIRAVDRNQFCPENKYELYHAMPEDYMVKYQFEWLGYNLKPLELQAAILCEQIKKLKQYDEIRQWNYCYLYTIFGHNDNFKVWELPDGVSPFAFPLGFKTDRYNRKDMVAYLKKNNIESRVLFGGNLMRQPAYASKPYLWEPVGRHTNSDFMLEKCLLLGVAPIIDKTKMEKIHDCLLKYLGGL